MESGASLFQLGLDDFGAAMGIRLPQLSFQAGDLFLGFDKFGMEAGMLPALGVKIPLDVVVELPGGFAAGFVSILERRDGFAGLLAKGFEVGLEESFVHLRWTLF